jgi:hypothetical protein
MQPAFAVGLISVRTGIALQEDYASPVGVLVRKGRDIPYMKPGSETTRPTDENQTTSLSATTAHQFSWINQRLVREGHIARCGGTQALTLYLLLVTVADRQA